MKARQKSLYGGQFGELCSSPEHRQDYIISILFSIYKTNDKGASDTIVLENRMRDV